MDATADELIARLRRNPDDASAFAALRAHYQRIGDWASLANLLVGWAARTPDHQSAAQAYHDAAELVWGALADRPRAEGLYEKALERNPLHADAAARLESMWNDAGDPRRLAEMLERRAEALSRAGADPRDVAALHQRIGEIWEHTFKRSDKAILHYRKAFEMDATLVPAIYAAREIYRQAGNIKAAATLCDMEAKAEPDTERKVALLRELAHMRAEALADVEGAVVSLKRALTIAPGDQEVMSDLARVYLTRAERGADVLVAEADRRRAADLFFQMAQQLPPADAVPLLEQALDGAPDHDGALGLLERIADRVGHAELLPKRWVAFLARAPEAPGAGDRRRKLARAYLDAGQIEYATTCLEWLLEDGDAEAAAQLVELYRHAGRDEDAARALAVAARGLPPEKRVPRLRELVQLQVARGDFDSAAQHAREILEVDPADPEALSMLEEHCRRRGAWAELRDLLLAAARVPGLGVEARKQRLREVASVAERRLTDVDGAIGAWKGVAALDPADREARASLSRLLESAERWDELVQVLEREALSILEPAHKAEVYRRLAMLHRERRGDLDEAIAALRHLRDLLPGDVGARDALCDTLLAAGQLEEAVPMLRRRIDEASPGTDRAALSRVLASTLETTIGDVEGAFAAWTRLLEDEPGDAQALERMEAIDVASGDIDRLLRTLSYRADVESGDARAATYARMGQLAEERLEDLAQAAELYGRALELAPKDEATLDALCRVYDRSERYKDLVVLLRGRARMEEDPALRAALFRRIARTLAERVGNEDGAAEAWREVLDAGEDREALEFLQRRARRQDDVGTLDELTERLANLSQDAAEKRELMMERAQLLSERLERPRDAIEVLRALVRDVEPTHVPALALLADLCDSVGDVAGLADALERTLAVLEDADLRVPVARRLADLYEGELADRERAITALYAWSDADLTDTDPTRRLVPLLEAAERWKDLVAALDSLADASEDDAEQSALVRRAAELSYKRLGDVEGAWTRLVPRVQLGDDESEKALRELARSARRGAELFALYAEMAADAEGPTAQARWVDAARVQEEYLGDRTAALEAVLKAFAVDLSDATYLDEVDRLAGGAGAWPRLAQVYETLIRRTEEKEKKVQLLLRHAGLLDREAADPSGALDRALRACSLSPSDDAVLAVAEDLAPRAGRAAELLVVYDRRRTASKDDAGRVEALLRGVKLCERVLGDREQAVQLLAQAVALSVRTPTLGTSIEDQLRAIDVETGAEREHGLLRAVVDVYAALAEDMEADPRGGAQLLLRAARILETDMGDEGSAYGALMRATTFAPFDDLTQDTLLAFARRVRRLPQLAQHLTKLADDALDSSTAAKLLKRLGILLDDELGRHAEAADVLARWKTVAPTDPEARERLRVALRRAGKHQDLLLALESDLSRTKDPAQQLAIKKEIALTWERGLSNKWEAIEAWNKVKASAPEDADALAALARLGSARRKLASDDSIEQPLDEAPLAAEALGSVQALDAADALDASAVESVDSADALDASDVAASSDDALADADAPRAIEPMSEVTDAGLLAPEPGLDSESLETPVPGELPEPAEREELRVSPELAATQFLPLDRGEDDAEPAGTMEPRAEAPPVFEHAAERADVVERAAVPQPDAALERPDLLDGVASLADDDEPATGDVRLPEVRGVTRVIDEEAITGARGAPPAAVLDGSHVEDVDHADVEDVHDDELDSVDDAADLAEPVPLVREHEHAEPVPLVREHHHAAPLPASPEGALDADEVSELDAAEMVDDELEADELDAAEMVDDELEADELDEEALIEGELEAAAPATSRPPPPPPLASRPPVPSAPPRPPTISPPSRTSLPPPPPPPRK